MKKTAGVLFGTFCIAAAIAYFIMPAGMVSGGVTGWALALHHFFGLPVSLGVSIFNLALFLLGFLAFGRSFALNTLVASAAYPLFLAVTEGAARRTGTPTEDIFLCMVFGGILFGLGAGMILRQGASSGGTDILALVVHKKWGVSLSVTLYALDALSVCTQCAFSSAEQVLYGLVFIFLYTLVIERIMMQGKSSLRLEVISQQWEEINRLILHQFDKGSTLLPIEGGYTGEQRRAVQTVVHQRDLFRLKEAILAVDPCAFIVISQVKEVNGRGFTLNRQLE